ncbi:response regulator transcription factor [Mucilaginibacter pallidiroseus]|uniref:Response regulator transcription factor n=1 Tax=Mucilaginibacter pallidiroseus TaxID=2599295 RepID=A0A563U4M8_9SPHI|nr:LuxR C-terminal-related transcriptional regulator [Mucilaginibacter pallidiroseus]TWR26314.1 response regulator transcription factor [Mucilaginibacter pallidiroseus]
MNYESSEGEQLRNRFGCMRVLIAVKAGKLQDSILEILREEPAIETIICSQLTAPVNELPERFSVVITDTGHDNSQKKELFNVLRAGEPALQALAIGSVQNYDQLFDWLCTGAFAAMMENEIDSCLVPVLMQAQKSAPILSAIISRQLLLILGKRNAGFLSAADYGLTPREKNVLSAIVRGMTYKIIGSELNISPETVRGHVKNIYRKLTVNSQSQAVAKAIHLNLV